MLPNPEGVYNHVIDTSFEYSHYSTVYLDAGYHTFTTINSTAWRYLTVFNQSDYTYSWANAGSGPGTESSLNLYVALAGYYSIMLRPGTNGSNGYTDIVLDGNVIVNDGIIGSKTYMMSALKGGTMNFFTCKLTAGDTRLIASRYWGSSVRGYNDDYYSGGSGSWSWGLASRLKKDFSGSDSVQYAYMCAYSPSSTGLADLYMGNPNSNVYATNYPEFPLLKADDAIQAAPSSGYYNCISWSGGITSTWVWPPSWASTYSCSGSDMDVTCFDNFYGNNPSRYPGAWTYSRSGATSSNALVDVWALNGHYTHGSVKKPGNNNPHGYDWESKPGGLTRTFHPRSALTNNSGGYGSIVNYYKHTGGFGKNANGMEQSFETDADAVKAGIAVFDVAHLSKDATSKLGSFLREADLGTNSEFEQLYAAWKDTWESNAIYSDPAAYCKNVQYENLLRFAQAHPRAAMLLSFDKYIKGDHFIGELVWALTKEKYSPLIEEVKMERRAKPNDEQGRFRIHGDHDNGVLYIEKILKGLEPEITIATESDIKLKVSPNPVSSVLTVQVITTKTSTVGVKVISGQNFGIAVLQADRQLPAGTHQFTLPIEKINAKNGDMLAVQVTVDGVVKTVKVLVTK